MPGSRARSDLNVYAWITPSFALDAGTLSVAVETEAHQLALLRDGAGVKISRSNCRDRAERQADADNSCWSDPPL